MLNFHSQRLITVCINYDNIFQPHFTHTHHSAHIVLTRSLFLTRMLASNVTQCVSLCSTVPLSLSLFSATCPTCCFLFSWLAYPYCRIRCFFSWHTKILYFKLRSWIYVRMYIGIYIYISVWLCVFIYVCLRLICSRFVLMRCDFVPVCVFVSVSVCLRVYVCVPTLCIYSQFRI